MRIFGSWHLPSTDQLLISPVCAGHAAANFRQSGIDSIRTSIYEGAMLMGKYFLGWIMGVPVVVLVVLYLIFN